MEKENIKSSDLLRDLHIYFNEIKDLQTKEYEINSFISSLKDLKNEIHNAKIGITDENLEEKLVEFLKEDYKYLLKDLWNNYFEYKYEKQDYDDKFSENDVLDIISRKTQAEREDVYWETINENCIDFENDTIWEITNDFCNKYDYISHDTEIQDILINIISFNYDTYLEDTYKVNILIDFINQDSNYEFATSGNLENCKHNNLYTLLQKQGYTKKDYEENLKKLVKKDKYDYDYEKIVANGGSKFLTSVKEEIDNLGYEWGNTIVVLQELTLKELIENTNFLVSSNNMIGLFNCFNGSGSLLEIRLEKDFTINREKDVYTIQIEGAKNNNYSVNDVYGLIGSCWK